MNKLDCSKENLKFRELSMYDVISFKNLIFIVFSHRPANEIEVNVSTNINFFFNYRYDIFHS